MNPELDSCMDARLNERINDQAAVLMYEHEPTDRCRIAGTTAYTTATAAGSSADAAIGRSTKQGSDSHPNSEEAAQTQESKARPCNINVQPNPVKPQTDIASTRTPLTTPVQPGKSPETPISLH